MPDKNLSRKEFLRGAAMTAVGFVAVACAAPTPQVIEKPVTVVVEKQVPVEKQVVSTVVVEKQVAVEKVVKETVVVQKEVEKQVVVTATPIPQPKEAPELAELVKAGKLPPVDQRLPADPLVITPYSEIGKYGGTWHAFQRDPRHWAMGMNGYSLVHWVRDGLEKRGGLASSWSRNADATEWTITLRKGVKWSDGQPCTVDDIIYWFEDLCVNTEHSDIVQDWLIAGGKTATMTKVDDFTLKIKYVAPAPLLPDQLAMWPNGVWNNGGRVVVPKHYATQFNPKYNKTYTDYKVHDDKINILTNPECPVLWPWKMTQFEASKRWVLERNPYYYAVDTAGNQLPYIDKIDINYAENLEVVKLKVLSGETEICMRACKYLPLSDISLLRSEEAKVGYHTELWDGGSGTGSVYYCNWNHPDPEKQKVYRNPKFRRALSHAIDRPTIQKMVYYGTGELTTGTMSPKAVEYHRSERGKELYVKWRDLAVKYDPELAKKYLDEIGVVDKNGDGWRELPNGAPLELRIDASTTASNEYVLCSQIVQQNWEAVGLKTVYNAVPGEQLTNLQVTGMIDIRNSWEVGDGPNHIVYPSWVIPNEGTRWAPLYGQWYQVKGTAKEGTELDKAPRDRSPAREEPPKDDPVYMLQELYDKAKIEPDDAKRDSLVLDMVQIHIDYGPFFIGTVCNTPTPVTFKNNVGNVPTREQLGTGGFTNPWIMSYFASVYPEQFYFKS